MEKRPLSISIIGWWLVITGLFGIYSAATLGSNPIMLRAMQQMHVTLAFEEAIAVVNVIISLGCGAAFLKGLNWSRFLYVFWGIVSLIISFSITPIKSLIIIGVIFYAVIVFFLFRPAANRWFNRANAQPDQA
ncbi:MAG TPA: hypothetical protein VFT61_08265 [Sphingomicrobium sp.]|nr:hypothetical protein [Sphingomicrobium sp.]